MCVGHYQLRVAASIARLFCALTLEQLSLAISRVYDTMLLYVDGRSRGGFSKQTSWSTVFRIPMPCSLALIHGLHETANVRLHSIGFHITQRHNKKVNWFLL